jgi:PKD repeat protein
MKSPIRLTIITLLLAVSSLSAATHYVSLGSTNPQWPYATWATAATNIQDAVAASNAGDTVLVTNGVYRVGQRIGGQGNAGLGPTRVVFTNATALRSVNGPQFTVINGGGMVRCAYLADGASLSGFTLTNGAFPFGGGGVSATSSNAFVTNCVIGGNSADQGGGAYSCTLYNCTLTGNSATRGGGAYASTLYNCTLSDNSSSGLYGGGAFNSTLYNCALTGNYGSGAFNSILYNCTLTGNYDGGVYGSTLYNSIVYFNTGSGWLNYWASTLNYCCATPLPTTGVGNIAVDPQLASASHLSAGSPCRGAGSATYTVGTDIDGEPWGDPPSIGCDEYHVGAVIGPLTVGLVASNTNLAVGYQVSFTALIDGRTTESVWDFGDGNAATNQPYVTHAWPQAGDYSVTLRAYNESQSGGVSATAIIHVAPHPVLYVAATSTNPQAPFASWATAATNIQQAVDLAILGAEILVTNGVYPGSLHVNLPLTVLSVNGPRYTIINSGGKTRCAYLADGASLSGFTLTNGASPSGGGGLSGTSTNAFVTNCVISGTSADQGSGANSCTLYNCTLSGNEGGGAWSCTLYNCTLSGNAGGGGASQCTLYNCTLTGNSVAYSGGGANYSTLYNCTLSGNSAPGSFGGGALFSTLYNCTLSGNSAWEGGGAWGCLLYNCTLTGNSADGDGGGASGCALYNCIVFFNTAPGWANYDYDSSLRLNYCCTTPLPTNGVGNISLDPQLASLSHLSAGSPCRGAGSAAYATGTDIDGESWSNPPSIGCDEYHAGAVNGPLTVNLLANYTNVAVGSAISFTGLIEGRTTDSVWELGDGDVVINQPYVIHRWTQPGDYRVVLWAFNESNLGGASATLTVHVLPQPVSYAALTSTNPQPPYTSWATAATNIQDAVDAAALGGTVLVSNGVYATGGRAVSGVMFRLNVDKPLTVRSVNGPQSTVINAGGSNACVYVSNGASVSGFTLTNALVYAHVGFAIAAPVVCAASGVVSNCVITGNSGYYGGGAFQGTLYNCTLTGNSANFNGGAAYSCTLYNCTLAGNQGRGAIYCTLYNCTLTGNSVGGGGGGAAQSTLYNCIVYFNTASGDANYDASCILNYCCTIPIPTNGVEDITNAPLFVDYANGNLRLQSNSPCINAGNNAYASGATDLDGNPRIVSGTVDIGAYEYQGAGSRISYAWLQSYGLPTDGSADYTDPDHDGLNNWQEWICATNPTNALSALRMVSALPTPTNATVTWQSVAGVNYFLERSADLAAPFTLLATNIVGQASTTSWADTNATGEGPFFYRAGVKAFVTP